MSTMVDIFVERQAFQAGTPIEASDKCDWERAAEKVERDPLAKLPVDPPAKLPGIKFDAGKDRMSLLPWKALRQVAKVLTFGAKKYGANNWQGVEGERYEDAFLRHYEAWRGGERFDEESGLPHLAHATCCLLFMLAQTEGLDGKRGS